METASMEDTYAWESDNSPRAFERYVALPGKVYERSSPMEIWRGVFSVLDKIRPDTIAICGYSTPDAWSALAWCKLNRRSSILMCASKYDDMPRFGWKEWLKQRLVRRFDAALCSGSPQRNYLEKLGMKPGKLFEGVGVVDNDFFWQGAEQARRDPADYRSMPGLESVEPFFLTSARFIKCKNLDGLIRAYAQYRWCLDNAGDGHPPWRLVILGDGPERSALEHLVNSEGIQGVSFPGFLQIDQLPIYYGLASVFIHPSHKDTWGLVVNEAMAAGLPILVSKRCGCTQDLVCEGENGFTFAPEDVASLASLMVKVSSGQADLGAMSKASSNRIKEWGPKRFAGGLYGALQVALKRKQLTRKFR
jgi:glycosyltransferase involved in cell wall biosynthesis